VLGDAATAREVWFVLHGYGQLAGRFIERFRALPGAGGSRAVVAPEALSRFYVEREVGPHGRETRVGASWMTRADREREIADYVEYLDRVAAEVLAGAGPGREPRLVVLGFSQGAETASRWATYGATRPAELILWGGGLAADLDMARAAAALSDTVVRFAVGDSDDWARERSEASLTRLRHMAVETERIGYAGRHRIEEAVLASGWPEQSGS
jgi:predicted esterase